MDFFSSQLERVAPALDDYWWSLVIESGSFEGAGREDVSVTCRLETKKGKLETSVTTPPSTSQGFLWQFKAYQYPHNKVSKTYKGIKINVKRRNVEIGSTYLPWEKVGLPNQTPPNNQMELIVSNKNNKVGTLRVISIFQKYQEQSQAHTTHNHDNDSRARSRTEQAVKKLNEAGGLLWAGANIERISKVTYTATGKREILVPTAGPAKFASYAELPPFDLSAAASKKVSFNNALWLCIAAQLAYKNEEIIFDVCKNVWDMDGFIFLENAPTDTQGFIMHNDKFMVISFRGTESMTNWKSNAQFISIPGDFPARYHQGGVRVHMGFHDALKTVWNQISEAVEDVFNRIPHIKLYICGHSLGGALATMCFAFLTLSDRPRPVAALYTIGQPRIGNKQFCKVLKENSPNTVYARITNNQDIVPNVPPSLCHFGTHLHISAKGRFSTNPTLWEKNMEEITFQQSLVTDHPTACYRILIEQEFARLEANRLANNTSLYGLYERSIMVIELIFEGVKGVHFGRAQLYAVVAQIFHVKNLLDAASEYFVLLELRYKKAMETQFQELNKLLVELNGTINKYRKKSNAKAGRSKEKSFNENMTKFCTSIQPICNLINDILLEVNQTETFVNDVLVKDNLTVRRYNPESYLVEFTSVNFCTMTSNEALDEAGAQIQELLTAAETHMDEGEFDKALKLLIPVSKMDHFVNFATPSQRSTHSFLLAKAQAHSDSQNEANEVLANLQLETKKAAPATQPQARPVVSSNPAFHTAPSAPGRSPYPAASNPYQTSPNPHHGSSVSRSDPQIPTGSNPGSVRNVTTQSCYPGSGAGSARNFSTPGTKPPTSASASSYGSYGNFNAIQTGSSSQSPTVSSTHGSIRNFPAGSACPAAQSPAASASPATNPTATGNYGSYGNYNAAATGASAANPTATANYGKYNAAAAANYGSYGNYNAAAAAQSPAASASPATNPTATANYGSYGNYNAAAAANYGSYGNYNAAAAQSPANPSAAYGSYANYNAAAAPSAVPQGGAPSNLYGIRGNSAYSSQVPPKNP